MSSDYPAITRHNEEQLGKDTSSRRDQVNMYSDFTHFIYELLQNADDYNATEVIFRLFPDELVVEHNGIPFNTNNVEAISYFGKSTSRDEPVKAGHFGLGFKSVFAFTATPIIHSGEEHFMIYDLYRLKGISPPNDLRSMNTRICLPFNHQNEEPDYVERFTSSKEAFEKISQRLKQLDMTTLLFTRNVREIRWIVEEEEGNYLRDDPEKQKIDAMFERRKTVITDGDKMEIYQVFARPVFWESKRHRPVEIAFEQNEEGNIIQAKGPLFVLFPTTVETHMGFLLNGPYRTPAHRETVVQEDGFNLFLIKETATLLIDVLHKLKEMNLLTISSLQTLPLRPEEFSRDSLRLFQPILQPLQKAFMEYPLLPTDDGSFVSAKQAKLAESADLRGLLVSEHLGRLYNVDIALKWLSAEISEKKTSDLRTYLMRYLDIEEVTGDNFARRITESFLETQTDEWMVKFYEFLIGRKDLWKKADSALRQKKFLRLEDNTLVTPRQKDGKPNAYLPGISDTKFPTIKRKIADNPGAREFLVELGILKPDLFAEIIEYILPKYSGSEIKIENEENDRDLNKISQALQTQLPDNTNDLVGKLRIVFARLGLEEYMEEFYQGSKIDSNFVLTLFKIALQSTPLFRAVGICVEDVVYKPANQIYIKSPDLVLYFDKNTKVRFLDTTYSPEIKELCLAVGGADKSPRITCRNKNENGYIIVANRHGRHTRGLDGFDPGCEIDGLECALTYSTSEKATYIWNELLIPNGHRIQGIVESSSKKTFENCRKETRLSKMGQLVLEKNWLLDKTDGVHKPCELSLRDLPEGFKHDENLARQLGMRSDEKTALAHELNLSDEVVEFIKNYPDEIISLMKEIESRKKSTRGELKESQNIGQRKEPPEPIDYKEEFKKAFARPSGTIKQESVELPGPLVNVEGYREKTAQETQNALEEEPSYETRFRRVPRKVWEGRCENTRKFLEEEYRGRCQVCDSMFIKRKDQKPYFEGLYIVHRTRAKWIDHRGNVLSLCPTCCAKFQYGPIEADDIMEQVTMLRTEKEGGESIPRVSIQLCGEECCIRFSERHLVALHELLNAQGYTEVDEDID